MKRCTKLLNRYFLKRKKDLRNVTRIYQNSPTLVFLINLLIGLSINSITLLLIVCSIQILLINKRPLLIYALISILFGHGYSIQYIHSIEKEISELAYEGTYEVQIIEPISHSNFQSTLVVSIDGKQTDAIAKIPINYSLEFQDKLTISVNALPVDQSSRYGNYLKSKNIHIELENITIHQVNKTNSVLKVAYTLKQVLENKVNSQVPQSEAAFLNGILFGSKNDLSNETKESFQKTGTSHIVAASGFNVAVVYIAVRSIFKQFLGNRNLLAMSVTLICFYSLMIGVDNIPAIRAAIMITILIGARYFGRRGSIHIALLISCVILMLRNPFIIHNISFQLSVIAIIGLLLFTEKISLAVKRYIKFDQISEGIAATIASTVLTLPLISINFGTLSIIAIFVNTIVLPLIPIAMFLGFMAILATFITPVSSLLFTLTLVIIRLALGLIDSFSKIDFASTNNSKVMIIYFISLLLFLFISDVYAFQKEHKKDS